MLTGRISFSTGPRVVRIVYRSDLKTKRSGFPSVRWLIFSKPRLRKLPCILKTSMRMERWKKRQLVRISYKFVERGIERYEDILNTTISI